jgi:hypothetical protein
MLWSDFTPDKTSAPLAFILRMLNHPLAASLISGAAIVALPTVIMVMMYGQTRVLFVMARDGLLPERLTWVDPKRGVPSTVTLVIGILVTVVSGTFELRISRPSPMPAPWRRSSRLQRACCSYGGLTRRSSGSSGHRWSRLLHRWRSSDASICSSAFKPRQSSRSLSGTLSV